jgi:hypothetical protein
LSCIHSHLWIRRKEKEVCTGKKQKSYFWAVLQTSAHQPFLSSIVSTTLSVGSPHIRHSLGLTTSETSVAGIIRVIHVVVDRIDTSSTGTTILGRLSRAAISTGTLHGCIGDIVSTASTAVSFESVQQTHPVTGLVDGGHAQVETVDVTAGHGVGLNHATIAVVGAGSGSAWADIRGETARAEDAAGEVGHEVDVMGGVGAIAQSVLHSSDISVCTNSPGVVDSEGGDNAIELDVAGCVCLVQDGELVIGHPLSNGTGLCRGGDDVESDINKDRLFGLANRNSGHLGTTVCLEDALVHQTHSLVEVLTGMTDVNTTVEVSVNSTIDGFGAGRNQKTGEANQDAGKVHGCLF